MENVFTETQDRISRDDHDGFDKLLSEIDFVRQSSDDSDDYFLFAMRTCAHYQSRKCSQVLYNKYEDVFMIEEVETPLFIYLLGETNSDDTGAFDFMYRHACPHFTYSEAADTIARYFGAEKAGRAIAKCESIFGRQSLDFYRDWYATCLEEKNSEAATIVAKQLEVLEEYAPIPEWIFKVNELIIPEEPEFKLELKDLDKASQFIFENQDELTLVQIKKRLQTMSDLERDDLVKEVFDVTWSKVLAQDENLFAALGPCHPLAHAVYPIEEKYGGSRMFLSIELEEGDTETFPQDLTETWPLWFTGSCKRCFRKIRSYRHALRMPCRTGGWIGCYCTSECVIEAIVDQNIKTQYLLSVWSRVYHDLLTFGIADQEYRPRPSPTPKPPPRPIPAGVIIVEWYDELADLLDPSQVVAVLYVDDLTSRGIIEAFRDARTNQHVFVLATVTENSDIEADPPELVVYYNDDIIGSKISFQEDGSDLSRDLTEYLKKVEQ